MEDLKKIQTNLKEGEALFLYYSSNDSKYSVKFLKKKPIGHGCIIVLKNAIYNTVIRYLDDNKKQEGVIKIIVSDDNQFSEVLASFCVTEKITILHYTDSLPLGFCTKIMETIPAIILINSSQIADTFLVQKDQESILLLKKSASQLASLLDGLSHNDFIDKTEQEIEMSFYQKVLPFSTNSAFPFSLVSGESLKVGTVGIPTDKVVTKSDPVAIDTGFIFGGYYTDITRMYFSLSDEKSVIYKKLVAVQGLVVANIKPGFSLGEIVSLYNSYFETEFKNYEFFPEDLGHSIGFALHEEPIFVQANNKEFTLLPRMVITLEPEILVNGYHYRIEDMVLVTEDGCEILTS